MKARLLCFAILLPAFFNGTHRAAAQGTPVFPIATNPAVMELANGITTDRTNYLIGMFASTNLSVQLVASNGVLLGSQIVLTNGSSSTLASGGLAFAGTNFLATWSDTSIVSNVDMFGQFISRTGARVGSPFNLLSSLGAHGPQAARALTTDGTNFLFVWFDGNGGDYYGQMVTTAGTLSGPEFLISGQSLNGNSAAAAFGKTNYLVVWQSDNGVPAHVQAWGELVSSAGVAGSPFQIGVTNSADEKVVDGMAVAFEGTNYLVVWMWNPGPQTSGTLTNWQIYGRLVSPAGTFPGGELVLTSNRNQALPALAFDGADYLLAYGYDSNTTNSDANLYFQFLDRAGGFAGPVFAPFAPQGTNAPLVAVHGVVFDGTRFAVAASFGSVAGSNADIYGAFLPSSAAAPVLAAGHRSGTQFPVQLTGTPGINYAIQLNTNLLFTNWTSLTTNSPTNGTFSFTDTNAANSSRFYRAQKQQNPLFTACGLLDARAAPISVTSEHKMHKATAHRLARRALLSFILMFLAARTVVFLIMAREMPTLYLFMHGTHVHHLNYGIFLLAAVAGYSVFRRPTGRAADITAMLYGAAMALTFDEFGMWLNLGGSYWQRASVDAVIVIAALLALVAFARSIERYESRHRWTCILLAVSLLGFAVVLYSAGRRIGYEMGPALRQLEEESTPLGGN